MGDAGQTRARLFVKRIPEIMAVVQVSVQVTGDFKKALRKFKKKTEREGVITDMKKSMRFEKPSTIRRRKKIKAIRRARKARAKMA